MKALLNLAFCLITLSIFGQTKSVETITKIPSPIYIVDNIIVDKMHLAAINPNEIDAIKVIKSKNNDAPLLDDLVQNGIIEIKMKVPEKMEHLNFQQAKALYNLPSEAEVHLNAIKINNIGILLSKEMVLRGRVLKPDSTNHYKVPVLSLETGSF